MIRLVLRGDALLDLVLGAGLLAATWDGLYDGLGLPDPDPALFAQLAGVLLVAFAYLLWIAPRDVRLTQAVAAAATLVNGLGALVVVAWLLFSELDLPPRGDVLLVLVAFLLAAVAAAEARIASRSVAMLLPPD